LIFPGYPGFFPGTLLAVVISVATSGLVSKVLYVSRCLAFSISLGLILSATLTVGGEGLPNGSNE
jgi:hypothetical protein